MATVSVSSGSYMRPAYPNHPMRGMKEGASQTFKKGYPVILSAVSGEEDSIIEATNDVIANIVGVAAEDASGTTGTVIPVWLAENGAEFEAHVQDTGVTAKTDVGVKYGLVKDSSNKIFRVDRTETTHFVVRVTKMSPKDTAGDTNGRVYCRFLLAAAGPYSGVGTPS